MNNNEVSKSRFIRHIPCEGCGSSDARALYEDGSSYCFSCNTWGKPDSSPEGANVFLKKAVRRAQKDDWEVIGDPKELPLRGLTKETCERFSYVCGEHNGVAVQAAGYVKDGRVIAQKLRYKDKSFAVIGSSKGLPLFGSNLWPAGGKMLVITEGEIDAMTVSQVMAHKWPVVSIPNGAGGAKQSIANSLEYVESFDKVVICFDADVHGLKATEEVAQMLSPGKAYVVHLPMKDANVMLQEGRKDDLVQAIWKAQQWRPDGIMSDDDMRKSLDFRPEKGLKLPWKALTDITYGCRKGELWTLLAGSGVGKSEFMKEIAYHVLREGHRVGCIFLEEMPAHSIRCILGKHLNVVLHVPEDGKEVVSRSKMVEAFDEVCSNGRLMLYDHRGVSDWGVIKSRIRFMAHQGAQFIILDHLTAIAYGKQAETNELIHSIMEEINQLAQELLVTVFMVSHIRKASGGKATAEEGGRVSLDDAYGSAAIKQRSNFVFALERNQQAENEADRNLSTLRCLKDRYTGQGVGKTVSLVYDQETGRLIEIDSAASKLFSKISF